MTSLFHSDITGAASVSQNVRRHYTHMKFIAALSVLFATGLRFCAAGEVALLVERYQITNTVCSITNSTAHEIYILPVCVSEEFHATPNCSDCATGWLARAPEPLGEWRDLIPVAPRASLRFTIKGFFDRPWRVKCVALTKRIHINDSGPPPSIDQTNQMEIYSAETQPKKTSCAPAKTPNQPNAAIPAFRPRLDAGLCWCGVADSGS
jgi:hypothetical protein